MKLLSYLKLLTFYLPFYMYYFFVQKKCVTFVNVILLLTSKCNAKTIFTLWCLRWQSLCPGNCIHIGWDPRTRPSLYCPRKQCHNENGHPEPLPYQPAAQSASQPNQRNKPEFIHSCDCRDILKNVGSWLP